MGGYGRTYVGAHGHRWTDRQKEQMTIIIMMKRNKSTISGSIGVADFRSGLGLIKSKVNSFVVRTTGLIRQSRIYLQISSFILLRLECFEQSFEISSPKSLREIKEGWIRHIHMAFDTWVCCGGA